MFMGGKFLHAAIFAVFSNAADNRPHSKRRVLSSGGVLRLSVPVSSVIRMQRCARRENASAIALALITTAILIVLGATSFMVLQNRFRLSHQTARWQEALLPAEAGLDLAINEVRKQLYMSDLTSGFFDSAEGWQKGEPYTDSNGDGSWGAGEAYRDLNMNGQRDNAGWSRRVVLDSATDHQVSFIVQAESLDPVSMGLAATAEPYWRVRAFGTVNLSGGAVRAAGEKLDVQLRKLSLRHDRRTGQDLTTPQVTRMVEAILKPLSTFRLALFGTSAINMNNQNIVVDSYDSRDTTKSTNGQYDVVKRQESGDVATNGAVINAGGAHIYGDAATNGGTQGENGVLNAQNVTGDVTNDFFQEVFPVNLPKGADGTTSIPPETGSPASVTGTTVLAARSDRVANYQLSTLTLSGQQTLTIKGSTDGTPTYAQIVVTGNSSLSGQAQIILGSNVYLRIFIVGDADFTGNGFSNPNSPLNLQLYGVDHYRKNAAGQILKDSAGDPIVDYGNLKISGNGGFKGAVYAPHYNIEMKGGGNADSIFGAFVGHDILMNGVQSVHYDEALGDGGLVGEYKVVSWFEDVR
jgi:hypothetical protein